MFTIRSQKPELTFSLVPSSLPEHYTATLEGRQLRASVDVYALDPREATFADFFERLARDWQHWRPVEEWSSLEGELRLEARMDLTGHVSIRVMLFQGAPATWIAEGVIVTEAGQLDHVATSIRQFAGFLYNAG